MSSDLQLKESHLETHWNGRLLKLKYATLRKKLKLEPVDDYFYGGIDSGIDGSIEKNNSNMISLENPIPAFVIRRRDMLEIEWEDGMIGKLKLS